MDDAPLFYLSDPNEKGQSSETETHLGEARPSVWLIIPELAGRFMLGVAATILSSMLFNGVAWLAQVVAGVMGDSFPYETWYAWYLAIIWVVIMAPVAWSFMALRATRFEFTSRRIYHHRGVLNKRSDQIEIARIRDLSTESPFWLRPMGLGNIFIESVDRSHPMLLIKGQKHAGQFKDWLHKLNTLEKSRLGYREFESTN